MFLCVLLLAAMPCTRAVVIVVVLNAVASTYVAVGALAVDSVCRCWCCACTMLRVLLYAVAVGADAVHADVVCAVEMCCCCSLFINNLGANIVNR